MDDNKGIYTYSGLWGGGHWGVTLGIMPFVTYHGRRIFSCNTHDSIARCDFDARSSRIEIMVKNARSGWINVDGIMWTNKVDAELQLNSYYGWTHYRHGYAPASWGRVGPVCLVGGLVDNKYRWNSPIATLPEQCRPR